MNLEIRKFFLSGFGVLLSVMLSLAFADEPASHEITVIAEANGNIVPSGTFTVNHGETRNFFITSDDGYEIAAITYGGNSISADTGISSLQYPLENITQDIEFQVEFRMAELMGVEIFADDDKPDNLFGGAVSISGDDVLIGAYGNNAAYIFTKEGNTWSQRAKLMPEGDVLDFGWPVSLSRDYALVGAMNAACIFVRGEDGWVRQETLTPDDSGQGNFGSPVSLSGDYALIGDYSDNGFTGAAYVFRRNGAVWERQAKLTGSDAGENSMFGASLAISGDYAVISQYSHERGTVYIFEHDGDSWTERVKKSGGAYFAEAVGISDSGHYVAISNYDQPPLILTKTESSWEEQNVTVTSDNFSNLGISDDAACLASMWSNKAYLLRRYETSWRHEREFYHPENIKGFGSSVSVSGDYAVVGADNFGSEDGRGGLAYIYDIAPVSEDYQVFPELANPVKKDTYTVIWDKTDVNSEAAELRLYLKDEENNYAAFSSLKIIENFGRTSATLSEELENGIYRLGMVEMHTSEDGGEASAHWITSDFVIGEMLTRTITASAEEGGTISPAGEVIVNHGSDQQFEFSPDAGWYIENISVDNEPAELTTSYTFPNVSQDHAIHVSFAEPNQKKGDINGDNKISIADVILCLQTITCSDSALSVTKKGDVNSDRRIGLAEAVYLLQVLNEVPADDQ
ncbi:InlB B-repeat-containing protein [Desulfonema magnum]|uniref:FG-GAP repeat-containing protein n=1 Tax=Desulfonema magnum TaxID=45655 RepID=A0A975BUL8_9BACT|nr:hypothetical protein [Desulfonema magnum]QTA91450.1 FG-GAP repeat-containing protein [Desulfonema magnum]